MYVYLVPPFIYSPTYLLLCASFQASAIGLENISSGTALRLSLTTNCYSGLKARQTVTNQQTDEQPLWAVRQTGEQ